jgi:glycosyltransferase involved in cell wall biosynthesis
MIKLSVVIITFNEERNIGRCLKSISGLADEIIVVDSGSTDNTEEICKKYNVRFIHHAFTGHKEQKNFAASQSTFNHILSLDADEALSEELKNEILKLKDNWEKDGYSFNRLTNYCGRWIRHSGWYPDRKLRLFNKDKGTWAGSNPHDKFLLNDKNNHAVIKGDLLHFSYYTIEGHMEQVNRFTEIAALSAFHDGKRSGLVSIILKPAVRFIRDYFFRLGILDGYYGFVICKISSHAAFLKYVKLYELQKNKKIF